MLTGPGISRDICAGILPAGNAKSPLSNISIPVRMILMDRARRLLAPCILFTAAILLFIVPACTLQSRTDEPRLDRSANFTQAALTLDAQLTLAAAGAFPTATRLSTQVGTTIPVITPTSPGDTGQQPSDPNAVCDRGEFIADVSIPDGTSFEPGQTFVKTWRLRNSGSCTWTPDYSVVFDSGDAMSGPATFPLSQTNIAPGQEVEISINLTAPSEPGNYRGDWRLRNPAGQVFGLGSQGTASFWVIINVEEKPDLSVAFADVHNYGGVNTAVFTLVNAGSAQLDSVQTTIENRSPGQTIIGLFTPNGACTVSASECTPGGGSVRSGNTAFFAGGPGANSSSGQTIDATFTFCSQEDLTGTCVVKALEFTIP